MVCRFRRPALGIRFPKSVRVEEFEKNVVRGMRRRLVFGCDRINSYQLVEIPINVLLKETSQSDVMNKHIDEAFQDCC